MAFGINREQLKQWKYDVTQGNIAFLTHYWQDERFPNCFTVTKVGCNDEEKLIHWGKRYGLLAHWLDKHTTYPHFDLFGAKQLAILISENQWQDVKQFRLINHYGRRTK